MGITLLQVLRLDDSSHRRLRKSRGGDEKIFGLRFVDVALEQFVYLRVAESEAFDLIIRSI